jgi:hypothetical protein
LAQEAAELTMANHRQGTGDRPSRRAQKIQLEQLRAGPDTDAAVDEEMLQVVTGDPVPAQNQVVAHVDVHRGDRERFAKSVT